MKETVDGSLNDSLIFSYFWRTSVIKQNQIFQDFENQWVSGCIPNMIINMLYLSLILKNPTLIYP
jgi:hypothetical protein